MFILANSADPDETSRFTASNLGLRCLYVFIFRMYSACSISAYFEFETRYAPGSCESAQSSVSAHTKVYVAETWADPEGRTGSGPPPPKKSQNIAFLSSTGPDPLKNHKAAKPAFNVWPSSARQRNAI